MKRSEVRAFLKSGVDALDNQVDFKSGLISYFNSDRKNSYPCVYFQSVSTPEGEGSDSADLQIYTELPLDNWSIKLWILDLDKQDSIADQYELIIDAMDELAQKLIKKYNAEVSGYKNVTINGITRTPVVKRFADCLSGVLLEFTLVSDDKTNVC